MQRSHCTFKPIKAVEVKAIAMVHARTILETITMVRSRTSIVMAHAQTIKATIYCLEII